MLEVPLLELDVVVDEELEEALVPDVVTPMSEVEKELSRELTTATLELLIKVLPSAGTMATG